MFARTKAAAICWITLSIVWTLGLAVRVFLIGRSQTLDTLIPSNGEQLLHKLHPSFTVIIVFTEPHNDLPCAFEDLAHQLDLLVSFAYPLLIYSEG